ncbi:TPA: allantoinase AllB [Candidatus Bathyarchaeota archaeon]|nr:allantoinase AllB [Candidatus Bathyarchaeota archaeon]
MKVDLLIRNGKVLLPRGELVEASIAVESGKIVAITFKPNFQPDRVVDAKGRLILPGVIDCHVHFREPGRTVKEDFKTGSSAAAVGGVTTVFDMPNTVPPTTSLEAFQAKVEAASRHSLVDFAVWGGISVETLQEAKGLGEAGVVGFKLMASSLDKRRGAKIFTVPEDGVELLRILEEIARLGLPLAVHAEDFRVRWAFERRLKTSGRRDWKAYFESIPGEVEASAAARVLSLARLTDARIHLVHVSSRLTLEVLRWARELGVKVTAETCPHYLLLTWEALARFGFKAKIDPPLKDRSDLEALWGGLEGDVINILASDHSPHTLEEKKAGLWEAPPGFCGVETLLPLMLNQVKEGKLSLQRLASLTAENPAKIFGLWGKKGALQPGFDADLVLVDLEKSWTVREERLQSKCRVTPWDGWKIKGLPALTMVRGVVVAEEGKPVGKPGWGQLVKPERAV